MIFGVIIDSNVSTDRMAPIVGAGRYPSVTG